MHDSRRNLLKGVAVSAVLAPASALAAVIDKPSASPQMAELLRQFEVSRQAMRDAEAAVDAIARSVVDPEPPQAIRVQPYDRAWGLDRVLIRDDPRQPPVMFELARDIEALNRGAPQLFDTFDDDGNLTPQEIRRREICEAHEGWWSEINRRYFASGLDEAEAIEDRAYALNRRHRHAIESTPAITIEDVLVKARVIASMYSEEAEMTAWIEEFEEGALDRLAISLTVDLIRIAGLMRHMTKAAA